MTVDTPTPQQLFDQWIRLAHGVACRHWNAKRHWLTQLGYDEDDIHQLALMRLWTCANKWRPDGGAKFGFYFDYAFWRFMHKLCAHGKRLTTLKDPELFNWTIAARDRDLNRRELDVELLDDEVAHALNNLTPKQREAVRWYIDRDKSRHEPGYSSRDMSAKEGIGGHAFWQRFWMARRALRRALNVAA
jgi:DNA-directed RNA polymerase specialized sigma24 family protein